jgi:hypothetical protein
MVEMVVDTLGQTVEKHSAKPLKELTMLTPISLPSSIDARPVPSSIRDHIERDLLRIQTFQDQWDRPQIEQFVAADFMHVFQTLDWILETQLTLGKHFLEWGCGFAVVTAMAASMQLDAIGIEAESDLIEHGRRTLQLWIDSGHSDASSDRSLGELVLGNFLPAGSESLADDPYLPSLGHPQRSAYEQLGLDLDDFSIVYSYPWPGEDEFHRDVFDAHAAPGALLLLFCGPNDFRLYRRGTRRSE